MRRSHPHAPAGGPALPGTRPQGPTSPLSVSVGGLDIRGSSPSTGAAFGSPPGHARSSVSFPSWLRALPAWVPAARRSESRARSSPRFIEWCVTGRLGEVGKKAVRTRDDEARVFSPLLDPPDLGQELAARLTLADELLARLMVGDLPDETGVEEMQTAIEIVLGGLLGEVSGCLFPELAERAVKQAIIDDVRRVLVDLNTRRVEIKHHAV